MDSSKSTTSALLADHLTVLTELEDVSSCNPTRCDIHMLERHSFFGCCIEMSKTSDVV